MTDHPTSNSNPDANTENKQKTENAPSPYAYSVTETCLRLGGISRSTFYRFVEKGSLATRKLGSRTVVMASEVERFLNALPPSQKD